MATRRPLNNQNDLAKALAHIYRAVDNGVMAESKARVLIYAVTCLSAVIKDGDLEARLSALEAVHASRSQRRVA